MSRVRGLGGFIGFVLVGFLSCNVDLEVNHALSLNFDLRSASDTKALEVGIFVKFVVLVLSCWWLWKAKEKTNLFWRGAGI